MRRRSVITLGTTLLVVALALVPLASATAPTVSITGGPSGTVTSTSADFTFDVTDDTGSVSVECSLDGGGYSACSSSGGQSYSGLGDGPHSFTVRATNADGNASDTRGWTVDTTGPSTSITSAPASLTNQTSATFGFSAAESATFACSLDGGGFAPCSSGVSYTGLGGGAHTFAVRATDGVGNTGPEAGHAWTIDTSAPTTTITGGPTGTTGPDGHTFTFDASEAATFECRLDGAGFGACSSGVSYSGLGDGSHTFDVRATDTAGNLGAPASRTWTVDAAPPQTTITSGPAEGSTTNNAAPTFGFTSSEGSSTFQCSVDGGGYASCSSPTSPSLADGPHTFAVRAVDAVGNVDATPASRSFTIDTAGPTTSIDSAPSGTTNSSSATFSFSASEAGVSFGCSLDGGGFTACTSPRTFTGLSDGSHTFSVRATDAATNVGPTASASWTIDATPPNTTLSGAPAGTVASTDATISFGATESPATFACSLDGAGFSACTSPAVLTGLADGSHTFRVRATDAAANTDPTPATATWIVDAAPPVIDAPAALNVEANGPSGSRATFSVSASDNGVPLLPGAISCTPPSGSLFPLGQTIVTCTAADALGNVGTATFPVDVVDTTPPNLIAPDATFAATSAEGIRRDDAAMAAYLRGISASDLVSDVTVTTTAPDLFPVGTTIMIVRAVDGAGNSTVRDVTITVLPLGSKAPPPPDLTPPLDVTRVRAIAGDHKVTVSWAAPRPDVAVVEVRMAAAGEAPAGRIVHRGLRGPVVLRRLRNDVEHRFVLVAIDAAGNRSRGVVALATPRAQLLARPKLGARVTVAPLLRWAPIGGASYFNVQVYRGKVKVLSAWPTKARYKMKPRWAYEKVKRALTPGKYTWYVWPGLGSRSESRYGPLLGKSAFVYVKPKPKPSAKKKQPAKKSSAQR